MKTCTITLPTDYSFKALSIATVLTYLILDLLISGSALAYRVAPGIDPGIAPEMTNDSNSIEELNILLPSDPATTTEAIIRLAGSMNLESFWIKINHRLQLDSDSTMPSRFNKSPHTELA